jgi:hypothetical protein
MLDKRPGRALSTHNRSYHSPVSCHRRCAPPRAQLSTVAAPPHLHRQLGKGINLGCLESSPLPISTLTKSIDPASPNQVHRPRLLCSIVDTGTRRRRDPAKRGTTAPDRELDGSGGATRGTTVPDRGLDGSGGATRGTTAPDRGLKGGVGGLFHQPEERGGSSGRDQRTRAVVLFGPVRVTTPPITDWDYGLI